jgi:glycosyltransferase involved in cell wall biosynthesis
MKCGAPVITGDRTSLPEVVGDGGLLVNPFDVDAIASAMQSVLTDSKLRSELKLKGLNRAEMFDWRKTARQTLEVYREAADNVGPIALASDSTVL